MFSFDYSVISIKIKQKSLKVVHDAINNVLSCNLFQSVYSTKGFAKTKCCINILWKSRKYSGCSGLYYFVQVCFHSLVNYQISTAVVSKGQNY